MNVLLTGSSGRVGRAVASELLSNGHSVTGFDFVPPAKPLDGVRYVQGSLSDFPAVAAVCGQGGFDAVAHLGAFMSWNETDIRKMYDSNVTGTFNLLESCKMAGIGKFIFVSSGETYPEGNAAYLPVDEEHPQKPMSFYGETKLLGGETSLRSTAGNMDSSGKYCAYPIPRTLRNCSIPKASSPAPGSS